MKIAARLKPFCHLPGTTCLIPLSSIQVQAFPTKLVFLDHATHRSWEEALEWEGPVEGFTVCLDLDKGCVELFGETRSGFKRHLIQHAKQLPHLEKLSLGSHTKLDWELVLRRMNMQEIAPVLFQLGQLIPEASAETPILNLLKFSDKLQVVSQLKLFYKAGFLSLLTPRLVDTDFQGITPSGSTSGSPLALLKQAYQSIRSLFFIEENCFSILPNLPPEFHAGRLVHLKTKAGDLISFEWSKKSLKKVEIEPAATREVLLTTQKSLTSFRVNKHLRQSIQTPLSLEVGKKLFLDRFEK